MRLPSAAFLAACAPAFAQSPQNPAVDDPGKAPNINEIARSLRVANESPAK